jgi:23S rRNA C2498 (ribose-2'-O)-methylase RlmM
MVSDVIAYPDKIAALLDRWCGGHWASNMIVTLKFQGDTPAWEDLDTAIGIARQHGYECRAKHFFNNKNEVTLMVQEEQLANNARTHDHRPMNNHLLGEPMYPLTLPVPVASQKV